MRPCAQDERRKANLTFWGYIVDVEPRFNWEREAHAYDGFGADYWDERNNRNLMLNRTLVGPKPIRESAKKHRK